jgi:predicted amidohydrolase YtcJ
MKRIFSAFLVLLAACNNDSGTKADLVIENANVYTVNTAQPQAEAVAVKDGKIVFVGSTADVQKLKGDKTEIIDAQKKFLMPGFIEGHGHIHGMGDMLMNLNLMQAKNWEEIVSMVAAGAKNAKPGEWIVGRGWHQEKWDHPPVKNHMGYPYYEDLDKVAPNNPVLLTHASGHGSFVNGQALKEAGISVKTESPAGGEIVKDKEGRLVGMLEEKAQGLLYAAYKEWEDKRSVEERDTEFEKAIALAEKECLRNGVTSFVDAGSSFPQVAHMKKLAEAGKLSIRHWMMVRERMDALQKNASVFPIVDAGKAHLTVKAIKVSLDGALGSYGAWFLEPYADKKGFYGQNTFDTTELRKIAAFAWDKNLQLCVHAIGDRANRETIDIFSEQIMKNKTKDHRWRVEHAQHVNPAEIPRFSEWNIIASMQGIHCTSDAPYVTKRLGAARAENGAYMWRAFMNAGVLVNNGTDVPVEDIDPFANFYSSVTRKLNDGSSFYPEQKMSRAEAIYSYTLANAKAQFEEAQKGSIEAGKFADLILLSDDLINCPEESIKQTKVLITIVGGKQLYKN